LNFWPLKYLFYGNFFLTTGIYLNSKSNYWSRHALQAGDDVCDDVESTSTHSNNEDLSTSRVDLSHDSSTDAPSITGSDRDYCSAETERRLSTSRELHACSNVLFVRNW